MYGPFGSNAIQIVEGLMCFAMGFLVAAIVAIAFLPAVQRRAARLALKRAEASVPLTVKEMQADRDGIRAQFAAATLQLENRIEALKGTVSAHASDLSRKSVVVTQLKKALDQKAVLVEAMQAREGAFTARENALIDELLQLRDELRFRREIDAFGKHGRPERHATLKPVGV